MNKALLTELLYAEAAYVLAVYGYLAGAALAEAGYHVDKGALTVSLNAGDTHYLALTNGE